jgi:uncharacterized membrane protein
MMPATQRYPLLDALRGLAIVMMFSFHFSYDLTAFGFAHWNFYTDPFWLNYRTLIVSTFLSVMGMSLYLAHRSGIHWSALRRRLLILGGCAALVSIGSVFFAGERWISFGILHFITVASLLGIWFVRHITLSLITGIGLILIGTQLQFDLFDQPGLHWIGLMTHKPATEDYVPLLPWFGVVLLGIVTMHLARQRGWFPLLQTWRGQGRVGKSLRWLGRHSLLIYMLHQPLFLGLLYLLHLLSH